jgi:glycosyltransferase involved in cell wall biosynthesis
MLLPVRDPEAYAGAIRDLGADGHLRLKMGEAGRRWYGERFTRRRFLEEMENLLAGVCDRVNDQSLRRVHAEIAR